MTIWRDYYHDVRIPRDATFPCLTPPASYDVYAQAYWLAAKRLFHEHWASEEDVPSPDFVIMPVLFLLHHYVELELKEIVRLSHWVGAQCKVPIEDLPSNLIHDLTKLLGVAESNIAALVPEEEPLLEQNGREIIEDLNKFGLRGEALRYPETKEGAPSITPYYVADVPCVFKLMEPIRQRFNGCIGWLYDRMEKMEDLSNR